MQNTGEGIVRGVDDIFGNPIATAENTVKSAKNVLLSAGNLFSSDAGDSILNVATDVGSEVGNVISQA